MPSTYSINLNIPNMNPLVPPYAHTPIPITQVPISQVPMPFGTSIYTPYQPDIIKKYDVKISTGDLGNIKHIYQDMVPQNNSNYPDRYGTITERLNIANYYGLIFNKHYSHYDENLNDTIQKTNNRIDPNLSNLLGHIKINYFNSYYKITNDKNILEDLVNKPDNFIMFNVCFPIKYENKQLTCAEDSLRAHMRIYKLFEISDIKNNKIKNELLYYKKIEELIKNKKYPNFVLPYGKIFTSCNIDFKNLDYLKTIHYLSGIQNNAKVSSTDKCLLMLTESVNYNIIQWATKQYDKSENDKNNLYVSTVISTGIRSIEAWKSVIFQLLVSMYILYSNNIHFNNFSLKNNVFIKKIDITPPTIKYWKYVIDGTEYYVPNHGFLVMIDSNFINDINDTQIDINEQIKNIFEEFINCEQIPKDIKDIINKINKDDDIKEIIHDNFNKYIYEKLGYMIPESELNEYKLLEHDKNFKLGNLVLYKKFSKVYIISSYIKNNTIFTNNKSINNYDENQIELDKQTVTFDLITKFIYKPNKEVIETYYIN